MTESDTTLLMVMNRQAMTQLVLGGVVLPSAFSWSHI